MTMPRSSSGWLIWATCDVRRAHEPLIPTVGFCHTNDFAADVIRYLTDRPVEACPPSAWYQFSKYARRNRAGFVTVTLVATAMSLGTAASLWQALRATRAEQNARSDWKRAEASDKGAESQQLACEGMRRTLGPEHSDTLASREDLASDYHAAGGISEAISLFESTLKLQEFEARIGAPRDALRPPQPRRELSVRRPNRRRDRAARIDAQVARGDARHGAPAYARIGSRSGPRVRVPAPGRGRGVVSSGARGLSKLQGSGGPLTIDLTRDLGALLDRTVRSADAEPFWRSSLDRQRAQLPADSPALSGAPAELGLHLLTRARWREAESIFRESLMIREKAALDDWTRFNAMSGHGGALAGQGRFTEAEPLLTEGYEGLKQREVRIPPRPSSLSATTTSGTPVRNSPRIR
jgi:hypothetical protein